MDLLTFINQFMYIEDFSMFNIFFYYTLGINKQSTSRIFIAHNFYAATLNETGEGSQFSSIAVVITSEEVLGSL
jgi:hypothetical protein